MIDKTTISEPLYTREQWICWAEQMRNGKKTKVPIDAQTGGLAAVTDDQTWCDFQTAIEYLEANPTTVDGLGFVFTSTDPIVGVDLDDCRDPETGRPTEQAKTIIDRLDSYTEVSPSETGYHVLVTGELPDGRNRCGHVEMYDHARYFTVTGDHVSGTPEQIEHRQDELEQIHAAYVCGIDDDAHETPPTTQPESLSDPALSDHELLEKAKNASNGSKFERLWNGSTVGYTSQSEADMALCCLLAFWTGGHTAQMDRLFRRSRLERPKWYDIHYADGSTYGEKTIARAIEHTSEFYEPPESTPNDEREQSEEPSRDRESVYLKERFELAQKQLHTFETQLEEKQERITVLERRLEALEGRPPIREEVIEQSTEPQRRSIGERLRKLFTR